MSASTFNEPNDEQIYVNKLLCTETSGSTSGASFSAKGGTFTVNSENLASDVTTQVLSVDSSGKLEADSAEVSTITVADEIHFTNRIRGYPVLDSGGGLVSNASLQFPSTTGIPYMTSASNEWRLGSNSLGSGIIFNWTNNGQNATITVKGDVNASNVPALRGQETWSGGGQTLDVAAAGCTSNHHIHLTPTSSPTEGVDITHVTAGNGEFTVHLSGANVSNDLTFNWLMYEGTD